MSHSLIHRIHSSAPADTGATSFSGPGSRWLLAPRDTRPAADVFPSEDADGALGQVTVSPDARYRLRSIVADGQPNDPLSPPILQDVLLPADFRVGQSWTPDDYRLVANLVSEAFEVMILRCPSEVLGLVVESPSYAVTHDGMWFAVRLRWAGLHKELQLRSDPVFLGDLDPTAHGIEAAWIVLDTVATQATSLLNDLAAEGVRTTEGWYDAQAEADIAADEAWLRHHRWYRLRWFLYRNVAFGRRMRAQTSLRGKRSEAHARVLPDLTPEANCEVWTRDATGGTPVAGQR